LIEYWRKLDTLGFEIPSLSPFLSFSSEKVYKMFMKDLK